MFALIGAHMKKPFIGRAHVIYASNVQTSSNWLKK